MRFHPFYDILLYILLNIQPEGSFKEPKHVAVNYLKCLLIEVLLDCIYYYFIYDLYSSLNIQMVRSSRTLKWPMNVARMGKNRNAYRVEVGKTEGKISFP